MENLKGIDDISVKLPNNDFSKLVSIDFDYYKSNSWLAYFWLLAIVALYAAKWKRRKPGYTWDDTTSREQRLAMWKNWIQEFNACEINKNNT